MNDPVLLGSRLAKWKVVVPWLVGGLVLLLSWGMFSAGEKGFAALLGAVGLILVVSGAVVWFRHWWSRTWFQETDNGFCVTNRRGRTTYRDDDVVGLGTACPANFSNGLAVSQTRHVLVSLVNDDGKKSNVEMINTSKLGEVDPLAGFVHRHSERLYQQAVEARQEGQPVLGQGWSLKGDKLKIHVKWRKEPIQCRLAEIEAATVLDNHLGIWQRGSAMAAAWMPLTQANAFVLARLLAGELAGRPSENEPQKDGDLGRLVFEIHGAALTKWLLLAAAISASFASFLWFFVEKDPRIWILALAAPCCCIAAVLVRFQVFRCHAFGAYKSAFGTERSLLYSEVLTFTYSATRQIVNGIYSATHIYFMFEPFENSGKKPIQLRASRRNADEQLEYLRDHVAQVIARRWQKRFQAGKPVTWTKNLRFLPGEGLEYHPKGWIGRKDAEVIPFEAIQSYRIEEGTFYLWVQDHPKPAIQEKFDQPNFFPGYFLLQSIYRGK